MDGFRQLCKTLMSGIHRKLLGQVKGSHYGDLVWVVHPEMAGEVPRRPWREELDRINVTKFSED